MTQSQYPPEVAELINQHNLSDPTFVHTNLIFAQCACYPAPRTFQVSAEDGGICFACGGLTVRTGSCTTCTQCYTSSGCS